MPVNKKASEFGTFDAKEIAMFWRIFDATKVDGETELDAEHRASRIIANYTAGIVDEAELAEMSRKPFGR